MIYLNQPLLSPEEIVAELEKKICKQRTRTSGISALAQLQKSLKSIYFNQNTMSSKAFQSEVFFQYPRLKYVLEQIFQNNTDIHIPAHLKDWQAQGDFFEELNQTYQYFNITPELKILFCKLVEAYRKIALLIEKSTFQDVNAYQAAYKLMVLFYNGDHSIEKNFQLISSKFVKICRNVDHRIHFPYHDALVVCLHPLPLRHQVSNLHDWKIFIESEGFNALAFFARAQQIGSVPKNLKDARMLAIQHKYKRAAADLSFANLCKHYVIPEDIFNKGIDVILQKWPYKNNDHLPDIEVIDSQKQYTWMKLHPHDKHAFILGNIIPECCQHIGGHAEQCVVNGIQLQDNGFYVLLKIKKNASPLAPKKISNQINYQDYDIVAQSYAWRTQTGNLCLDSIEWNPNKVTTTILQEIMLGFSQATFKVHPEIKRVNIGTGGKTPQNLFPNAIIQEKMKQGYAYSDSLTQYCIAQQTSLNLFQQTQLAWLNPEQQKIAIYLLAHFSANESHFLIQKISKFSTNIRLSKIHELLCTQKPLHLSDFEKISLEEYLSLPAKEQQKITTACKIWNSPCFKDLLAWLPHIDDEDLLNILKLPDNEKNAIAHLFINTPKQMLHFLQRLNTTERLDLLNLPFYERSMTHSEPLLLRFLQKLIGHPQELKILIDMLQPEDYAYLLGHKAALLEQAMAHAESFELLFSSFHSLELFNLLKFSKNQTHEFLEKATQYPNLLKSVFNFLPSSSHLEWIIYTHRSFNLLYHASAQEASFEFLLSKIPQELHEKSIFPNGYESPILFRGASQFACLQHFFKFIPESAILNILFLNNASNIPFFCVAAQNTKAFEFLLSMIPIDIQRNFFLNSKNQNVWVSIAPYPESLKLVLKNFTPKEQSSIFSGQHVLKILKACHISAEALQLMFNLVPSQEQHHFMNFKYLQYLLDYPLSLDAFLKLLSEQQKKIIIEKFFLFEQDDFPLNHPSLEVIFNFLPDDLQWNWIFNCIKFQTPIHRLPAIFKEKLIQSQQYEFIIELKRHFDDFDSSCQSNQAHEIKKWVSTHRVDALHLISTLQILPSQYHEIFLKELHQYQAFMPLIESEKLLNYFTEFQSYRNDYQKLTQSSYIQHTRLVFFNLFITEHFPEPIHANIAKFLNHFINLMEIKTTENLSLIDKWKLLKNIVILQDFIDYKQKKTNKSYRLFSAVSREEEMKAASQLMKQLRQPNDALKENNQHQLQLLKKCRIYNSLDIASIQQRLSITKLDPYVSVNRLNKLS